LKEKALTWIAVATLSHGVVRNFPPSASGGAYATEWTRPSTLSQRLPVSSTAAAMSEGLLTSISRMSGTGFSFLAVICVIVIIRPKLVRRSSAPSFCASTAIA
jgi:hypothetical protein